MRLIARHRSFALASCLVAAALAGPIGCGDGDEKEPSRPPGGGDIGLASAPAALALREVAFDEVVVGTFPAGDTAVLAYEGSGFALMDVSRPESFSSAAPDVNGPFSTTGEIREVVHDAEGRTAYLVDASGAVHLLDLPSAGGASIITSISIPALAQEQLGMARVGNWLFVAAGTLLQPIQILDRSALVRGAVSTLDAAPTFVASGGKSLYFGYASGRIEQRPVLEDGSLGEARSITLEGEIRALFAKGSKLIVLAKTSGLSVVDFAGEGDPRVVATNTALADPVKASLFGRTLLVSLERGMLSTIDVSNFAEPRAVTTNAGQAPAFASILGGTLVFGSARSATLAAVPPVVSGVPPAQALEGTPLNAQIPITFSKPIEAASASNVVLNCAGQVVAGGASALPDGLGLVFTAADGLPANANCSLDLSGVTDRTGQNTAPGSKGTSVPFTTGSSAAGAITSPGSAFTHVPDGRFSDFGPPGDGTGGVGGASGSGDPSGFVNDGEWSDVTPARGMYTYFYADFDGQALHLLNDWYYNGEDIDPDCYNLFNAWTGGGSERWEIRAYGDQRVEVRKNGQLVDTTASGVRGGFFYGASPNVTEPHTIYELAIPAAPGGFGVQLHDPGPTFQCQRLEGEPTSMSGNLATSGDGRVSIDAPRAEAPVAPTLSAPEDGAIDVPLAPVLSWATMQAGGSFAAYHVEIAGSSDFSADRRYSQVVYGTELSVPYGVLAGSTDYRWRVTAWNYGGSAASATWDFTTVAAPPAGEFALYVGRVGLGTVSSNDGSIACGDACTASFARGTNVVLTASPQEGSQFLRWDGSCRSTSQTVTVTMDAGRSCVAYFGTLEQFATLTVAKTGGGTGRVTSSPQPSIDCGTTCSARSTTYPLGTVATLTAVPDAGNTFDGWAGDCTGGETTASVTMNSNRSCVAYFTSTARYELTTSVEGSGSVSRSPAGTSCGEGCSTYPANTSVTLVASPAEGQRFVNWTGDCAGTNPVTAVQMTADSSCVANFVAITFSTLTITVTPAGRGSVTSSPVGIECSGEGSTCAADLPSHQAATLYAVPSAGYRFLNWSGDCQGGATTTVSMAADRACTATFEQIVQYTLTVTAPTNGSVLSSPTGIANCGVGLAQQDCTQAYDSGQNVLLYAQPNAGYAFSAWTGDCAGTTSPVTVAMTANRACSATFALITQYTLTVTATVGGTVTSQPAGISACSSAGGTCMAAYNANTTVSLTAVAGSGYQFSSWGGNCDSINTSVSVIMSAARTCTATFTPISQFALTVTPTVGGVVNSSPVGISSCRNGSGTCTASYNANTSVNLQVLPDSGYTFSGWGGACDAFGTAFQATVSMSAARTCTATFTPITQYTLTVSPTVGGAVASQPAGISACRNASGDCTQLYNANTVVSLGATPDAGYQFAGWGGNCTGIDTGTSVTMTANRTCTATFTLTQYTLTVTVVGTGNVSGPGIDCSTGTMGTCAANRNAGTTAFYTATPATATWSGGCTPYPGANPSEQGQVSFTANRACTVTFP